MAAMPAIYTYHCLCSSLLLASTHRLSQLPRRQAPDQALILPLPPADTTRVLEGAEEGEQKDMAPEGYTLLLNVVQDRKAAVVRREDGFEKRLLSRCARCALAIGYEIMGAEAMDVDGEDKEAGTYKGKIIYLLPGGLVSTEDMKGHKIQPEDVEIGAGKGIAVFD